jgi:hypothetical protein
MNPAQQIEIHERDRLRLRGIVSTIDRELSRLSLAAKPDPDESNRGLMASWAQLVELLALGLAPEVRDCPVCQHVCMRAASRCGHCWAHLAPSTPPAAAVATT